jgi:hypothetical protein
VGEQEDEEEELIEEVKILNDLGLLGSCFVQRTWFKYTLKRWPLSPDPYRIIPVFFPLFQQKQAANIFYQKNY